MLVLARKKNQSIMIGKNIKISVVDVNGETVRIGIEAPADMEIFRSEIYAQLQRENTGSLTNARDLQGIVLKKLLAKDRVK